jgi:hypothetical protein
MSESFVRLRITADNVAVASLRSEDVPSCTHWLLQHVLLSARFVAVTDTDLDFTLLLPSDALSGAPSCVRSSGTRFVAIQIDVGDLGFDVAGVVNSVATPLGLNRVPICYVSTFSTDLFLVPAARLADARRALEADKFRFVDDASPASSSSSSSSSAPAPATAPLNLLFSPPRPAPSPILRSRSDIAAEPHVVLSVLPFTLRMVQLTGDLTRFALHIVRLLCFTARSDRFFSLVRLSSNELSLVVEQDELDLCFPDAAADAQIVLSPLIWRCVLMTSLGTGLEESGVMLRFTKPLADAGVSIFKVTTTQNDYTLLRNTDVDAAFTRLKETFANVEIIDES